MKKPTTITSESVSEYREFVELRLRKRVLEGIGLVLDEELDQALGCRVYERSEARRGYRNGVETRRVTTAVGTRELRVPRARVVDEETGETKEFRSELLPRYQRRTREVDEATLTTYLSGANSRRIRKALKPLLGEEHLSKSAVSRVVGRLRERFDEWQGRDLQDEHYPIVFLDGFHLKVRMAKRVVSVPVLAALGVAPDGQKHLLSLRLAVSEASTHWSSLVEDLRSRGLQAPKLVVSDGHKGLTKALESTASARGASSSTVAGVRGDVDLRRPRLRPERQVEPLILETYLVCASRPQTDASSPQAIKRAIFMPFSRRSLTRSPSAGDVSHFRGRGFTIYGRSSIQMSPVVSAYSYTI